MSKVSRFATLFLGTALSLTAAACTGPVFIRPTATDPVAAAGLIPGTGGISAVSVPAASISPWHGAEIFVFGALLIFVALGVSMYAFRARPE